MELKRKDIKRVISGIMKRKLTKYMISLNLPTLVSGDRASY